MRFNNQEWDEDGYEADRRMHQEKDDALTEVTEEEKEKTNEQK